MAMGVTTWAMVSHEADDALGAAAAVADADERVEQVLIITPDKDLGQCVRGTRVVQYDRRKREIVDEAGVIAKFGVPPASIPDYLGLVGDSADGFPGIAGWGAKSAVGGARPLRPPRGHPAVGRPVGRPRPARRGQASAALQQDFAAGPAVPPDRHRRHRPRRRHRRRLGVAGPTAAFDDWAVAVGEPRLAERAASLRAPPPQVALLTLPLPHSGSGSGEPRRRSVGPGRADPCASRRRPGDLRHTGGAAEGCYLPVLTWFAGTRCTGPDRRLVTHGSRWRQVSRSISLLPPGGVRERPNRHAWKACVGKPTVGSNPTPSAHDRRRLPSGRVATSGDAVGDRRGPAGARARRRADRRRRRARRRGHRRPPQRARADRATRRRTPRSSPCATPPPSSATGGSTTARSS